MCVAQDAHCHNYSSCCLTWSIGNVRAQKTELIVAGYLADIVLRKGSDKCIYVIQSLLQCDELNRLLLLLLLNVEMGCY